MPSPLPFLAAAFAAAVAVVPVPASGPTPWTPPIAVGPGDLSPWQAVGAESGAVLVLGDLGRTTVVRGVAGPAPTGRSLPVADVEAIAMSARRASYLHRTRGRVAVSFGDPGARSTGRPRTLHRGASSSALLAVGEAGDTLVSVGTAAGRPVLDAVPERLSLHWSTGGAQRRWRSMTLPGRAGLLAAAVDARGTATLLLQRPDGAGWRITARTLALHPGRLSPERTLDRTTADSVDGVVATNRMGAAVLAWGAQDGGEEADRPYRVRAARRAPGSTTFGRAATLDPGTVDERPGGIPVAAIDDAGTATVAWSQARRWDQYVPRAAVAPPRRPFGPRRDLLPSGTVGEAAARGTTTLVSVAGARARPAPDEPDSEPSVAGVVARTGAHPGWAFEPVATARADDVYAPLLSSGAAGFRAVWPGSSHGRPALRLSSRATD